MDQPDQGIDPSVSGRLVSFFAKERPATPEPAAPAAEPTVPESEPAEETQDVAENVTTDDQPAPETAEQPDGEGLEDVEWEGKQYRLTREVKDALMRHRDYKSKTQELADLRRHATALAEQQRLAMEFHQETGKEQNELNHLQAQIRQYKDLNWAEMDMEQTFRARAQLDQLKDRAADLQETLGQKHKEFSGKRAEKHAAASKAAYDFIGKHVPGFGPDSAVEKEVANYSERAGLPVDAFVNGALSYPSVAVLVYKAMQYDKLQTGKQAAVKAVQKAPPVVKPGAISNGNASAEKAYQTQREKFKKSGDIRDAERLLLMRMKGK